ncbi:unnamed protein product, partial [Mesorhabditis belari]|uniref:Ig-like domain-containing protein n=1 Tax=Mesorhabditis belari TaxID=2138241 RepID=A0AAF3EB53_9BILA
MRFVSCALLLGSVLVWVVEGGSLLASLLNTKTKARCSSLSEASIAVLEQTLQDGSVPRGESVTLLCSVTASPPTGISWYKDGKLLNPDETLIEEELAPRVQIGIATVESRLVIPCFSKAHAGKYTCQADTRCGATQSQSATLSVDYSEKESRCRATYPPVITQATMTRIEMAQNPVHLMCRAVGVPKPRIAWTRVDDEGREVSIENDVRFQKQASGDLIVFGPVNSEVAQMEFRCTARNPFGEASYESVIIYTNEN